MSRSCIARRTRSTWAATWPGSWSTPGSCSRTCTSRIPSTIGPRPGCATSSTRRARRRGCTSTSTSARARSTGTCSSAHCARSASTASSRAASSPGRSGRRTPRASCAGRSSATSTSTGAPQPANPLPNPRPRSGRAARAARSPPLARAPPYPAEEATVVKYHLLTACAAALLAATPAAAKTVNIGVSMSRSEHLFLVKMRDAMQKQANGLNDVSLQFEDAQGDVGRQVNQVQNFIAQGVDAIIVNAADTSATAGITKMVTGAGIPLVYVNLGPGKDEKLPPKVAVVVSDHIVSGRLEMDGLAKCMHDKGNVVTMLGELASNATDERTAGNKEVIAKHPDIKVVQEQTASYQRNQAIDLMNNWITNGVKFDTVAANNDEMAIGAIFAMQQAGVDTKTKCVGGIGATADALDQMKKGNLAVTVFQDAKGQGRGAIDAALKLVKGEKVDTFVMIPYELVTPENIKSYENR